MNKALSPKTKTATRKWKPYPAYKDSGIPWLGKIPAGWEAKPFKRLGNFQGGAGFPDDKQGLTDEKLPFYKVSDTNLESNEVFMVVHNNSISRDTAARLHAFVFPSNTIVFAKVGATLLLNKRRILVCKSCIDNNMMGFIPKSCDVKWAYYWMCGLDLGKLANPGAVPSVNEGQLRDIPVPVPSQREQRAIAAFLDRETKRIDGLIGKKERLIELLQEKRIALISHAVTQGLDPHAPMKDSGIPWLGKIPAGWEAKRLRFLIKCNPQKNEINSMSASAIVSFVPMEMVEEYGGLRLEETKQLEDVINGYTYFRDGDVVVAKITPCFENGKGAIAENLENGIGFGSTELHVLRPGVEFNKKYLFYLTMSHAFRKIGASWMYGAGGQKRVPDDFVKNLVHPIPSVPEQESIAAFLDRETERIDGLIGKIREAIDKLREYRAALISAAVTGKIDVRGEATT